MTVSLSYESGALCLRGNGAAIDMMAKTMADCAPSVMTIDGVSMMMLEPEHLELLRLRFRKSRVAFVVEDSYKRWQDEVNPAYVDVESGPVMSRFVRADRTIPYKEISKALSFFVKAALQSRAYRMGHWDGTVSLYKAKTYEFPSGCLSMVEEVLKKHFLRMRVTYTYDTAPPPQFKWTPKHLFDLTQDQKSMLGAILKQPRGIVKAATGVGKTSVVARYATALRGVPTLFVANRKQLLDDAANDFINGIDGISAKDVGKITSGNFCGLDLNKPTLGSIKTPIVMATIQSLAARLEDPKTKPVLLDWLHNTCKQIIVDETQAVGTKQWDMVLDEVYAPYRVFLSATPKRTDGATIKIEAYSGPVIYSLSAESQIEAGRLCEMDIRYQVYDHGLYNEDDKNLEHAVLYEECIVNNKTRNMEYIVKPTLEMVKEERFVLVLIQRIEHGEILQQMFLDAGVPREEVRFIYGSGVSDKERHEAIDAFRQGKYHILIGSTIFDVGVDIKVISGVVLGGAGNSDITLVQRIGRGARECDYEKILGYTPKFMQGKDRKVTLVYDIADTNVKFFRKQAKNRYNMAVEEFGRDRVHVVNGSETCFKKKSASARKIKEADTVIDTVLSKEELLNMFK